MSMNKVYREVARKYGITVEEVEREMQSVINETYNNTNHDDVTRAYQDRVPRKGEVPTVVEFISYIATKAKNK